MSSWVSNKATLFSPLPYMVVKFPPPHHMFSIFILWHCYACSWDTMYILRTDLRFSLKVKDIPSTRVVHLTEMRLTLVLVGRRVYPIIPNLWSFYQIWIYDVTNLEKKKIPSHPQLDHFHPLTQEEALNLKFSHPSCHFQDFTHQSSRCLDFWHPQFRLFSQTHLLEIWHH